MTALLDVRALSAGYGPIQVLHDIAFTLESGEVIAVLGANGAGKTTLLRAISGMIPRKGQISYLGKNSDGVSTESLTRLGMAHVPEHRGTFAELTVEENLQLGAYASPKDADRAADRERIYGYFPKLRERRHQQAGTLSGGEQQMLAIGRALGSRPKVLLLDEPSFGLAPQIVQEIYRILQRLRSDQKVGIVLVEQHAALALDLADRALVLAAGRAALNGTAVDVRADARVQETYLGGSH